MAEPESEGKPLRPIVRWVALPLAGAWIGVFLSAPFILIHELAALVGMAFGAFAGLAIAVKNPKSVQGLHVAPVDRRWKPATLGTKWAMAILALVCASLVVVSTQGDVEDKGLFYFLAIFIMISMARRALRVGFEFPGSIAGMVLSGALLTLLLKSAAPEAQDQRVMLYVFSGFVVYLEAWDEARALKRMWARKEAAN